MQPKQEFRHKFEPRGGSVLNIYLGKITEEEKRDALQLNTEKGALRELLLSFSSDTVELTALYERVKSDYIQSWSNCRDWWLKVAAKYNWSYDATDMWSLNSDTNEVYLQKADTE